MSFSTAFLELMPSTMKHRAFNSASTDGYLTAVYSSTTNSWRCRIVHKPTLVRTDQGTEEMARVVMWVRSTTTFSPYDSITVGGSTIGPVLAVHNITDEDGHHHSKVMFA